MTLTKEKKIIIHFPDTTTTEIIREQSKKNHRKNKKRRRRRTYELLDGRGEKIKERRSNNLYKQHDDEKRNKDHRKLNE
jgi:hypothetical protein